MPSERWRRIEELYHEATERAPEQRAEFLHDACPDLSLRREVESLLLQDPSAIMPMAPAKLLADILDATHTMAPSMDNASSDAAPSRRPSVGQAVGNYEIISALGKGGMGEVYLALDPVLDRKVAVKLLPAEFTGDKNRVRRFAQEAKAASALNHPNIVSIYGFGESEFGHFIVMELIEGQDLRSFAPWPLEPGLVNEIGGQVAKALEVTHDSGLIHRDIKPDNIMIRRDGLVKVLDFGLARLSGPVTDLLLSGCGTVPGTVMGTVRYMSPEQARGEWLTEASDIFSVAIVFYELATGQHPFHADSAIGYLHSIVSRQAIPPSRLNPAVPSWFETLLLRMLEKDPAKRCTARELVLAFQQRDSATLSGGSLAVATRARGSVGRKKERAELHSSFQLALDGRSTMLSISGEPGQGKTTLIEEFLMDLVSENKALVAHGRCSERLAGAGAYLPVLEFLDSLLNSGERELVAAAMKSLAPTWYAQLSVSGAPAEGAAQSQEKLKRELAALLQEISRQQPLVIFLDDVHWADISTVDLLSYLTTRLDRIRALILVSYRAPELHSGNQQFVALQLELQTRGICREMALGFFTMEEIREYIDLKFPGHTFPDEFAGTIHQRTEGNPLFVADLLRHLQQREAIRPQGDGWILAGSIAQTLSDVPESVRSMVQRKMEQLSEDERKVLMAASVEGSDFDAAVLAKALDADPADVEEGLEKLERKSGFVRLIAEHEYPDRSLTLRYRFVHVLYQNAFYAALRPTRRASLSKAVAEALLQFHGAQAGKIAAQVAFLFDTARDFERAARHYQVAAQNALQLFANGEAEALARRGLDATASMTEGGQQALQELGLRKVLAGALRNLKTHSDSEATATQRRLLSLSEQLNDYHTQYSVHYALAWSCHTHQEFDKGLVEAVECLRIAGQLNEPCMTACAHLVYGDILLHQGRLADCLPHLESVGSVHDPAKAQLYARLTGVDPCAHARGALGLAHLYLGYPDRGQACLRESVELARQIGNPIAQGVSMICAILSFKHFRDQQALWRASEELTATCFKNQLQASMLYFAKFGQGWALALKGNAAEGLVKIDEAIADCVAIGSGYVMPMLALGKSEVVRLLGRYDEAIGFLDEQLAAAEGRGQWLEVADLYRSKGECLLSAPGAGLLPAIHAEECFLRAIEVARRLNAKLSELEAATALAELYRAQNRKEPAVNVLSTVYSWFTEGFGAAPLRRAKALLEELSK